MIDLDAFRARAPEFAGAKDPRVQAALDSAELRTDAAVFGALTDDAHFYLAAHLLAASPTGSEARLSGAALAATGGPEGATLYLVERRRLEAMVAPMLADAVYPVC